MKGPILQHASSCDCQALLLVMAQVLLTAVVATASNEVRMSRKQLLVVQVFALALMLLGVFGEAVGINSPSAWVSFTCGAVFASMPIVAATVHRKQLVRVLLNMVVVLGAAFLLGSFCSWFQGWVAGLTLATLGLLVVMVLQVFIPNRSAKKECVALGGVMLFAFWTVYDITGSSCTDPYQKSIAVFLDILNLFSFSSLAS